MQVDASENDEKTSFSAQIGKKLRILRRQRGWSQTDLGEHVGLSMATISNLETGRTQITVDYLAQFADALGCSPGDFFDDEPTAADEQAVILAIRSGDSSAAVEALAQALGMAVEVAATRGAPSYPLGQLEDLGRKATQFVHAAAGLVAGAKGQPLEAVVAEWASAP